MGILSLSFFLFYVYLDRKRIREAKVESEGIVEVEAEVVAVARAQIDEDIVVMNGMSVKERQEKKSWKKSVYVKLHWNSSNPERSAQFHSNRNRNHNHFNISCKNQ